MNNQKYSHDHSTRPEKLIKIIYISKTLYASSRKLEFSPGKRKTRHAGQTFVFSSSRPGLCEFQDPIVNVTQLTHKFLDRSVASAGRKQLGPSAP